MTHLAALVIGIGRYDDGDRFETLVCAENDAQSINIEFAKVPKAWIRVLATGGAGDRITAEEVYTHLDALFSLASGDPDGASCNCEECETHGEQLRSLGAAAARLSSSDLVIYFSGHAVSKGFGLHLLTSDARSDLASGVSFDAIMQRARRSSFRTLTIILDCCFAGGAADDFDPILGQFRAQLPENVCILASSPRNRTTPSAEANSPYTKALLQAFQANNSVLTPFDLHLAAQTVPGLQPVFKAHLSVVPALGGAEVESATAE